MTTYLALLNPISEAEPCGEDMVFSSEFDRIREARRFDDPSLEQGDWVIDLKEANWPVVIESGCELLAHRTKDIRLAAWLTEAWAKTQGFAGLRDGYLLVANLCERYWDGLYPLPDAGDEQQRVGNLSWLIKRSQQLTREIPLTQADGANYTAADWDSASFLANAVKRSPDSAAELMRGKFTLDQFDQGRRNTPPAFYKRLVYDLDGCAQALAELERGVGERLGDEGPSFAAAREGLMSVRDLADRFAREAGLLPKPAAPVVRPAERIEPMVPALDTSEVGSSAHTRVSDANGPIATREQALAQLREVADFFRRTEPHSPVAYLADKAASWGEMSLHLWLRTVMKDGEALSSLEDMLGIDKRPDA
jgi:type VI secretion system protein ImpA